MEENKVIDFKKNEKETTEKDFNTILNELANIQGAEGGLETFAMFLALPDEIFTTVSETYLFELEKALNDSNVRLALIKELKANGIDSSNIYDKIEKIEADIEEELKEIGESRREFLRRAILIIKNCLFETVGAHKKIINIPIELCNENAKMPSYANDGDAGVDIYALEDVEVFPGETVLIKTGLKVAIPIGYELQVRPKSGRALKTKLRVANTPGTIDSGYRDEIGVIIENVEPPIKDIDYDFDENGKLIITSILHGKPFIIEKGQKFAQLVLNEVPKIAFEEVQNINDIEGNRGGGFGSSGLV